MKRTIHQHHHLFCTLATASICVLLLMLTSCEYALHQFLYRESPVETRSATLTGVTAPSIPENDEWSFIIITDVHFGASIQRNDNLFLEEIRKMTQPPAFCICLGDSTEHGTEDEYKAFYKTLTEPLEAMGIPIYTIAGNHDLYNDGWNNFTTFMNPGSSFYTFSKGNMSFYFLDSASGNIGITQMNALKNAFKADSRQKIILSHVPLYSEDSQYFVMQDSNERNELISLFADNNVSHFFCGHTHNNLYTDFSKFKEVNIPAYLANRNYAVCTVNTQSGEITHSIKNY